MWYCSMQLPQKSCFMPETTRIEVPYGHKSQSLLYLSLNSLLEQTTSGVRQLVLTLTTLQVWYGSVF